MGVSPHVDPREFAPHLRHRRCTPGTLYCYKRTPVIHPLSWYLDCHGHRRTPVLRCRWRTPVLLTRRRLSVLGFRQSLVHFHPAPLPRVFDLRLLGLLLHHGVHHRENFVQGQVAVRKVQVAICNPHRAAVRSPHPLLRAGRHRQDRRPARHHHSCQG